MARRYRIVLRRPRSLADLRSQGLLTKLARFIDHDHERRAVMTVDLRGWGDTKPADQRYDMAGWGSRERWLAYVSAALGDPVMAMRIRDGVAFLLAYLLSWRSKSTPNASSSADAVSARLLHSTSPPSMETSRVCSPWTVWRPLNPWPRPSRTPGLRKRSTRTYSSIMICRS